jgi:riboflavin synthase
MFTGIVQDVGRIAALEARGGDLRVTVEVDRLSLAQMRAGDSIAVAGVCLTVLDLTSRTFAADVSNETRSLTTFGDFVVGARVNLEPALRAGDALGGHLVSGHVDGLGTVLDLGGDARSMRVRFRAPNALARYLARKGSVTIDGVSLTVNDVEGEVFGVNLIPHTWTVTTLGELTPGRRVNLEIDQVARYVERLLGAAS